MYPPLDAWNWPGPPTATATTIGLINQSWFIATPNGFAGVMQRLNTKIFTPEVHEDIEAVTRRLDTRGLLTPRLVPTRTGLLWHTDTDRGVWRVLTHVGDRTPIALDSTSEAHSAGTLIGRFHAATHDLDWTFRSVREGAHDTDGHMAHLKRNLETYSGHHLHAETAEVAAQIFSFWSDWSGPTGLPKRVIHGDLKVSNIRFQGPDAVSLVDLDTLANGTIDIELGDAMRSWCNRASEDTPKPTFDLDIFKAAMSGYAQGSVRAPLTDEEWASIVPGIERICIELASRFAWDALEESYFGWDPRFGTRGEHNLLRARGQLALACDVAAHRSELEKVIDEVSRLRGA